MSKKGTFLYIKSYFPSIQGESSDTGFPTLFIRLAGCNLQCSYCDTKEAWTQKKAMRRTPEALMDEIYRQYYWLKRVCITGGEPLFQPEVYGLIVELEAHGYEVSIETNGSLPIFDPYSRRNYKYVLDIKGPSSGMSDKNYYENLAFLTPKDEVKFVVANKADYDFSKRILYKYPTMAKILYSPMFLPNGKSPIASQLSEWLLKDHRLNCRLQIQTHKIIGVK